MNAFFLELWCDLFYAQLQAITCCGTYRFRPSAVQRKVKDVAPWEVNISVAAPIPTSRLQATGNKTDRCWKWAERFPGEISGLKRNGMRLPRRPRHVGAKTIASSSGEVAAHGANIGWISQEGATNARHTEAFDLRFPFLFLFFFLDIDRSARCNKCPTAGSGKWHLNSRHGRARLLNWVAKILRLLVLLERSSTCRPPLPECCNKRNSGGRC